MTSSADTLVGKHVKCVIRDGYNNKVVYGVLEKFEQHDIVIVDDLNNKPIIIGRPQIVMLKSTEGGLIDMDIKED